MNPRELQIIKTSAPMREVAAWFIAGADAPSLLEELSGWAVPHEALALFIVPRAAGERAPGGLLVLLPSGCVPPRTARGLPLGVIDGRLFLPVDAELWPPVTQAEVRSLCRAAVTLFHPGMGAVEFETADRRLVWDLLERPALRAAADWNGAVAGAVLSARLAGVTLLTMPQGGDVFGDAGDDIGSESMTVLPPLANEPRSSPVARIGRSLTGITAAAIGKVFSLLPATGARRTWVNDVMDWAASKLAGVSQELEQLRHRELHRLMEMLDSDPDRGLRHALPLDGPPGRGRSAPGAQLGPRDTRFDLARIGGGRGRDHWDVPAEIRRRLLARYRELALREQRLGRFQRAAYIHAELLGDLSAAATVLREGRLFAEAAALYRDHLHQTRAAAECYVAGGFFAEAIAIFEKEGAFLELGDLHRRLENEPAAEIAFRKAIEVKVQALDFMAAAVLLEERLSAPDEALALLGKGWPGSPQAALCLAANFALLGRLGRHEAARHRLSALSEATPPTPQALELADVMKTVSRTYPDRSMRPLAADLARVKVSEALVAASADEMRRSVGILHELTPEDRLLARDTSRFVAARLQAGRSGPPPLPPRKAGSNRPCAPVWVHKFPLPYVSIVDAVKHCGRYFIAVVRQKGKGALQVVRGDWEGRVNSVAWESGQVGMEGLALVLDEHERNPQRVMPFAFPLPLRVATVLPKTGTFPHAVSVVVPSWMPDGIAAVATSTGQWWTLRESAREFILECRSDDGRLTGSTALTSLLDEVEGPIETISMLALETRVWVALGRELLLFHSGREVWRSRCESPIIGLEASAPFLPRAAVARCSRGVAVFWADHPLAGGEMLATNLVGPRAVWLRNGALVLLSSVATPGGFAGQVIDLDRRGIHSATDFVWSGASPIALVATDVPNGFAIFTHAGEVHLHEIRTAKS
jgi:tetratricopeptide (TPR) repeat protein